MRLLHVPLPRLIRVLATFAGSLTLTWRGGTCDGKLQSGKAPMATVAAAATIMSGSHYGRS